MFECLLCERPHPEAGCHIIVLTEQERAQVQNPLERYVYCKPCWKVLSDPVTSPVLMSGVVLQHLRQLGVERAEELAANYRQALSARAVRRS